MARALIQEGETEAAKPYIAKALELAPALGRTWFFQSAIQKADGDYEGAVQSLERVRAQYPRDRVALNDLGRIFFLERKDSEAVATLQRVLSIDPEDLQAHYNLMLCYQGLGEPDKAKHEQQLYLRFKADESAQALTGAYRQTHPEDNNERQSVHEHESAPLKPAGVAPVRRVSPRRASAKQSTVSGGE